MASVTGQLRVWVPKSNSRMKAARAALVAFTPWVKS